VAIDANNGQIRFGIFELDPRTRELRRNGVLVKLQDQPFQVLLALTGKPGELVTREELHKRVWPDDTFVDYTNLSA
jgi:DNA-binding winged helix-turn-helix (wHTH) protein